MLPCISGTFTTLENKKWEHLWAVSSLKSLSVISILALAWLPSALSAKISTNFSVQERHNLFETLHMHFELNSQVSVPWKVGYKMYLLSQMKSDSSRNSIQSSIHWKEEQTPLQLFPISLELFLHICPLLSRITLLGTSHLPRTGSKSQMN